MSDKKVQLSLRIPKELDEKLKRYAEDLGISENAYITMLLSKILKEEK